MNGGIFFLFELRLDDEVLRTKGYLLLQQILEKLSTCCLCRVHHIKDELSFQLV